VADKPIVLRRLTLAARHRRTGNTRHYGPPGELPPPVELQIVRYSDALGYYLFYMNEEGVEQSDTWHETMDGAMDQAEFEFKVRRNDWSDPH
jgi:hypothetical protein